VNGKLLDEWRSSLQVIRLASEEQLAIIESAQLCFNLNIIHPDAQFLFNKTINLQLEIHYPTAAVNASASINTPIDLFEIMHTMPNLEMIVLRFQESVKQVDHFTPSLLKLKKLYLRSATFIEFSPTAFDQLVFLEEFSIRVYRDGKLNKFETGIVARSISCGGVEFLKLTSKDAANIEKIRTNFMVESNFPLTGVTELAFNPDEITDLSTYFRQFANLRNLSIGLSDLNQVNRGQLSCLSKVTHVSLRSNETTTIGIYIFT
jgi:hypothetical protein